MYAGNVGLSQSLDLVLGRRRRTWPTTPTSCSSSTAAARPGPASSGAAAGLPNVRFVDMQPKERLPEVLAAADIHVVPLKPGLAWSSVPSKLYSILAAAARSWPASTRAPRSPAPSSGPAPGSPCRPTTPRPSPRRSAACSTTPTRPRPMGAAGRRFVEGWASPAAVAEAYEALFDELIGRPSPA